jgi:hypothetical protein
MENKLTRKEWESIEIPISNEEKIILSFIITCYESQQLDLIQNQSLSSLSKVLKLSSEKHEYLFNQFFAEHCESKKLTTKVNIKAADKIRIETTDKELLRGVYEFILLDLLKESLENKSLVSLFSLHKLLSLNVDQTNPYLKEHVMDESKKLMKLTSVEEFIWSSKEVIEKNPLLLKCESKQLYQHQKALFQHFQNPLFDHYQQQFLQEEESIDTVFIDTFVPKMCFYVAPTGTGKTLSPIALCSHYRVIFVCAARHVGLSLARSAISMGKKVAFAFGCQDTSDIRLHNSSAVVFERDYRSGGIRKIDHSDGSKVEIIICDLTSYLCATWYMKTFNHLQNILTFWDEPTISLDSITHPMHGVIRKNWLQNTIPNIIFSSATLPTLTDLVPFQDKLRKKFPKIAIFAIENSDFKKTICCINPKGYIEMPHYICETFEQVLQITDHLFSNQTLLRYLDLEEILSFLRIVENSNFIRQEFFVSNSFQSIDDVSLEAIKLHYLNVLRNIKKGCWGSLVLNLLQLRETFDKCVTENDSWGIYLSTKDASSLTDGPTLFLADNTEKVGKFLLQQSNIPKSVLETITKHIDHNAICFDKMEKCEKIMDTFKDDGRDGKQKGDFNSKTFKKDEKETKHMKGHQTKVYNEYEMLKTSIKKVELPELYTPNKPLHLDFWNKRSNFINPFCSEMDSSTVEQILSLREVTVDMKFLLLMGVGVFTNHVNNEYLEIIKALAANQKLFLIIANSDYIYGTNYQFSHAYLSKDLHLTQEKLIQCMGRVGRSNVQNCYTIRFRDHNYARLLFFKQDSKLEAENMNRIFS